MLCNAPTTLLRKMVGTPHKKTEQYVMCVFSSGYSRNGTKQQILNTALKEKLNTAEGIEHSLKKT